MAERERNLQNPYRGLRPYGASDAALFHGRGRLIQRLQQQLLRFRGGPRSLVVLGPSGSGKSSLVQAGLWPELQRQGAASLFTVEHPCLDPFEQLSRQGLPRAAEDLAGALIASARSRGGRAVLVVDHAEELLCNPDGFLQKSLIEQLTRLASPAASVSDGGVDAPLRPSASSEGELFPTLILILRDDCVSALAAVAPALTLLIELASVYVPATLELQEWMSIVREPARAHELSVEPALLAAIARDLSELEQLTRDRQRRSGVVSLLSFVLTRVWERRSGATLRLTDYQAVGGLRGALCRWADAAWSGVPNKVPARRALLSLLDVPTDGQAAAMLLPRPRALSEWRAGEAAPSVSSSIEASASVALVTLYTSGLLHIQEEDDCVELCHSVLLEEWPTLAALHDEEQRFLRWHQDMVELAESSVTPSPQGLPPSALSTLRLSESERWLAERPSDINGAVRRYIERRRMQQERARLPVISAPLLPPLILALLLLLLVGGLFGQWYFQQRGEQRLDAELSAERGARASLLVMQPGQDSAALVLAIKAVAPSLRSGSPVPALAKEGLMTTFSQAKNSLPLHGHTDRVDQAIFDPSGQRVLTGSTDRTARIWDARSGRLLQTLSGHLEMITSVAFSPDGTRALTTSMDHSARLWDSRTGQLLYELAGHTAGVEMGTFSPDGRRVVTAGHDRTARLWDAYSGRLLLTLAGHGDRVTVATFSRDGQRLLTASWDRTARLWDPESGALLRLLEGHSDRVNAAAFAPDGRHIATGGWDRTVRLWDTRSFESVSFEQGTRLQALCFSPDSHWLATTGADNVVKLWDVEAGKLQANLLGHRSGPVFALDFAPDSTHLVTAGADRQLRLWDVRVARAIAILPGHSAHIYTAAFSQNGSKVVTASYDQTARIWDVRAGLPLAILHEHTRDVNSATFSPDGTRIVTASDDQTAKLWRWPGGNSIATLREHRHVVNQAVFSADGSLIATASSDHDVRLWDGSSGQPLRLLAGHQGPVYALAFSPDGSQLVSGGADHTLRQWDPKSGALRSEVPGHRGNIRWITFSPDGRYLLTVGSEGEVWLRDGKTLGQVRLLRGHSARVTSAHFYLHGGELRLVTASSDRTVRIWNPVQGSVLSTLQGFADDVVSVALSPDARRLLIVSRDIGTRIWDLAAEMPLAQLTDYEEEMVTASYAPPNGRYFLIGSSDGTVRVYADDYPANLAGTLSDACDLLRYQRDFERVQADCPPGN